ncbi:hypothetical protein FBY06_11839 [Pseudomonas sp. SJZ085]|uniref:hypothetical protein n=1 Tax=unclassified Pseudomonas TaxID=196821 RepID=UPI0011993FAE|nr:MULTISPECIES: hypothetical protein [unclassified Pseudomonas]TWC17113.1 hypothetical protein FBX99_118105 [Pseudomonas sp. SJZ074]TWC35133.1 hypothetical protein FBY06_11839 [Pseudomonas sp. SJZ085]
MSQIKERPIPFSAPMVRAILDGRKTVTRRPVKGAGLKWLEDFTPEYVADPANSLCPYGKPGDRLWVRETCFINDYREAAVPKDERADCEIVYRADGIPDWEGEEALIRWRPSIHMPRWVSRILLEIIDVRVEQLRDISEEQAQAEGCFFTDYGKKCFHGGHGWKDVGDCPAVDGHQQREGWMWDKTTSHEQCLGSARHAFGNLWNKVNGPDAWDANPWVWVVEFKRVQP